MVTFNIECGITADEFDNSIKSTQRAIIPIGSLEQHGKHLPVLTDSLIAEHIAKQAAETIRSFVFPAISYGISFEHKPMFNVSLRNFTLSNMMHDICLSLAESGLKRIIILNGHHGNSGALQYIMQDLYGKINDDVAVYTINYWHLMRRELDHAGEIETSIMLAIKPGFVRMDKARATSNKFSNSKIAYQSMTNMPGSFPKITGNGIWGDPRKATAKKGHKLLDHIIKNFISTISELD